MQNLEFIDRDHFEYHYHRKWATGDLSNYIDFCWQTDFDQLLSKHPQGFSDVLFPNIGYTYIINLGTPFVMQINDQNYQVKAGGFLPRHQFITCHHSVGNQLFGIKFKVCPVLFQKDVDFSEYKERVFPLAYLIEAGIVDAVKKASSFAARVRLVFEHYNDLIQQYDEPLRYITIVTNIIKQCTANRRSDAPIEELARQAGVSKRTLQRYFEVTTGFSSKPALQTIKMRQALTDLAEQPATFNLATYGFYDYSHFSKHLRQFVSDKYLKTFQQFYSQRHNKTDE